MIHKKRPMKTKTIKKVLNAKLKHFANSITDPTVKQLVLDHTIITGGAICSMMMGEDVNDFDLYFESQAVALAVAKYYVKKYKEENDLTKVKGIDSNSLQIWVEIEEKTSRVRIMIKSAGIASTSQDESKYKYFENSPGSESQTQYIEEVMVSLHKGVKEAEKEAEKEVEKEDKTKDIIMINKKEEFYKPQFLTSNAITLTGDVQLIFRFYGAPEEIHKNYDFTHCTNYWLSGQNKLVMTIEANEAIRTKELIYQGSKYPICSLIRMRKFIGRGWTINAGQILKMAFQIKELDLHNPQVIADQLIGVDVAYFIQLIEMIKQEKPEVINSSYIASLVDQIF